jgi:hypothetical protein
MFLITCHLAARTVAGRLQRIDHNSAVVRLGQMGLMGGRVAPTVRPVSVRSRSQRHHRAYTMGS